MRGPLEQRDARRVAPRGGLGNVACGDGPQLPKDIREEGALARTCKALAVPRQRLAASKRLQAADVSTSADDRIVADLNVPDVSGAPLESAMKPPVRDETRTDSRADLEVHDVLLTPRDTGTPLAQGHDVDIVVDPDRRSEAGLQAPPDGVVVPARHDRRRGRPADAELDRPGQPDAHTVRRLPLVPGDLVHERLDAGKDPFRAGGDVGHLGTVGEDAAVQVGERDVDGGRAEIRHEDTPRASIEAELTGSPPPRARAETVLDQEPELDQITGPFPDDGASEARSHCDLVPRPAAADPDCLEDPTRCFQGFGRRIPSLGIMHLGSVLLPSRAESTAR